MGSKKVDVGFLPPDAYVQAHKQYGVKVLLQAERFGYKEPDDQQTNQLVNYYRAQIVVRKGSGIKNLKDLKGKKIAVQDTTSSSGWVFPVACMEEHGININKDHIQTVQVKGYDQAVMSVYNGNTDAAFIFQGARNLVKKDAPDSRRYAKGCSNLHDTKDSKRYNFSSRRYESGIPKEIDQGLPKHCEVKEGTRNYFKCLPTRRICSSKGQRL